MDAVGSGSGIQPNREELKPKAKQPASNAAKQAKAALGKQADNAHLPRELLPVQHRTTSDSHLPAGEKAAQVSKGFFAPLLKAGKKVASGLEKIGREIDFIALKVDDLHSQGAGKIRKFAQKGVDRASMAISNLSDENRLKAAVKENRPALEQKKGELEHQINQLTHILDGMSTKDKRLKAGDIRKQIGTLVNELSNVNGQLENFDTALKKLKQARAAQAKLELKLADLEFKIDVRLSRNVRNHPDYPKYEKLMNEAWLQNPDAAAQLFEKARTDFKGVNEASEKLQFAIFEQKKIQAELEEAKNVTKQAQKNFDQVCPTPAQHKKTQAAELDKNSKQIKEKTHESLELGKQINRIAEAHPIVHRYLTVPTDEMKSELQKKLEPEEMDVISQFFKVESELNELHEKQRKLAA